MPKNMFEVKDTKEHIRKTFTFEGKRYTVRGKTEKDAIMKMANKIRDLEEGTFVLSGNTRRTRATSRAKRTFPA